MLSRHAAAPCDRRLAAALGTTAAVLVALFAYAANGQGDGPLRPVTMEKVQALVALENAAKPAIPLVANQAVLDRINGYRVRPGQASSLRAALERGETFKPQIEPRLKHAKLPVELLAIPFVESRFQNVKQKESGALGGIEGAGIWMFIKQTARRYGLIVNQKVDERLDVERETGAAIRYLSDLHDEFGDWHLALAAYNEGEGAVRAAVSKAGTRDAWKLVEGGHLNDYLVYITAGILIMKYPELID